MQLYTYQDAIQHLMDYCGGNNVAASEREIHKAARDAYNDLVNCRQWRYLLKRGRVDFVAPVNTTCSSSGNAFTKDTGTWPASALGSTLRVGLVGYPIVDISSDSTIIYCDTAMQPITDIVTGTSVILYKGIYTLPADWRSMFGPSDENNRYFSAYIDEDMWNKLDRYTQASGSPLAWTIMEDPLPQNIGLMAIYCWPYPDSARTFDYIYQRWARELNTSGFGVNDYTGTVSNSAGVITGLGTSFDSSAHAGAVLRISPDSSVPDVLGPRKFVAERLIRSVTDATHLTYYGSDLGSISGRGFTISDPLDLAPFMVNAYWRNAERFLAITKTLPQLQDAERNYAMQLEIAKAGDAPSLQGRSAWDNRPRINRRLARMPLGPDA